MPNIKLKYAVVLLDYKGNSERMIKKKKKATLNETLT